MTFIWGYNLYIATYECRGTLLPDLGTREMPESRGCGHYCALEDRRLLTIGMCMSQQPSPIEFEMVLQKNVVNLLSTLSNILACLVAENAKITLKVADVAGINVITQYALRRLRRGISVIVYRRYIAAKIDAASCLR